MVRTGAGLKTCRLIGREFGNEGGREAKESDFQIYSAGAPIVANPVNGSAITGSVSVVDLTKMQVIDTIIDGIGLHPTGMARFGDALLVANTYSDTISVIDTRTNKVMRTINLGLPIKLPGHEHSVYGAGPNSIAIRSDDTWVFVANFTSANISQYPSARASAIKNCITARPTDLPRNSGLTYTRFASHRRVSSFLNAPHPAKALSAYAIKSRPDGDAYAPGRPLSSAAKF